MLGTESWGLAVFRRHRLLSTTMLSGVVGFSLLAVLTVRAADLGVSTKAPALVIPPAVDGINGKVDGFGGSIGSVKVYGSEGVLSVPLQRQYGLQLDGRAGSLDGTSFGSVGAHLFWRNPNQAMFGLYGDFTNWNRFGGVRVGHAAAEGAYYNGQFTLEGIAGVEFGNSASSSSVFSSTSGSTSTSTITVPEVFPIPGSTTVTTTTTSTTTTTTITQAFTIPTRFFDQINVAYYPTDNLKAYVGHRYLGGLNAAALGAEYGLSLGHGLMGSAFAEARFGEHAFHGVWGGLKLYFGQSDKSLIARQRRDDPPVWSGDSLFTILNNHSTTVTTGSSTSSTTTSNTTQSCNPGEVLIGGVCGFLGSSGGSGGLQATGAGSSLSIINIGH
jgi:hypothetical protein